MKKWSLPFYLAFFFAFFPSDLFAGGWHDRETGFIYMKHRYYDPQMRGFISRDPLDMMQMGMYPGMEGIVRGMTGDSLGNLYAAFERNPGTYTDPWGLMSQAENDYCDSMLRQAVAAERTGDARKYIAALSRIRTTMASSIHSGTIDDDDPDIGRWLNVLYGFDPVPGWMSSDKQSMSFVKFRNDMALLSRAITDKGFYLGERNLYIFNMAMTIATSGIGAGVQAARGAAVGTRVVIEAAEDGFSWITAQTAAGEVRILTEIVRNTGGRVTLKGLEIEGLSAGALGRQGLNQLAQQIGKQLGAKELTIEGARRSTGLLQGALPRPVKFLIE